MKGPRIFIKVQRDSLVLSFAVTRYWPRTTEPFDYRYNLWRHWYRFTSHISPLRAVKLIFKGVSLSVSPLLYGIMPKGSHLLSSAVANLRNVFFSLGEGNSTKWNWEEKTEPIIFSSWKNFGILQMGEKYVKEHYYYYTNNYCYYCY